MATGYRDLSTVVTLPTGWDATKLTELALRDGTTYAEVVARINAALGGLNAEFGNDWFAELAYVTDEPTVEYRVGVSNGFEVHTEYGRPDAKRAETEGHMLPFIKYDRMLGWTADYLEDARIFQIEADIADAIKDARDKRRVAILTRLLDRDDDSGVAKGLGSSGYSPGFATAAASTSVDFTPPAFEGSTFDSNHEHYVAISGGVFTNAVFQDIYDELREHGHEPPFDVLVGPSDRATVEGLSKFTPVASGLLRLGLTQDVATVGDGYFGVVEPMCRVREVRGVPQYYGFGYKTYGRNSPRNPLRIRVTQGRTALIVVGLNDPNGGMPIVPLQNFMLRLDFGVGVGDRTNGTPRYVNNSTWADGTPT